MKGPLTPITLTLCSCLQGVNRFTVAVNVGSISMIFNSHHKSSVNNMKPLVKTLGVNLGLRCKPNLHIKDCVNFLT